MNETLTTISTIVNDVSSLLPALQFRLSQESDAKQEALADTDDPIVLTEQIDEKLLLGQFRAVIGLWCRFMAVPFLD
jgi:hypothetical protein